MKLPKRDLLFAAEVPEQEPPPRRRSRTGQVRVWKSLSDIPVGTLVMPAIGPSHLYVTTRGSGWWMTPNSDGRFPEIASVESCGAGWALTGRSDNDRGPFTEVLP